MGKQWKQWETYFFLYQKSLQMVTAAIKLKTLAPWKKSYDQPRQHIKSRHITLPTKGLPCRSYHFSSSHVCVWELDHKESWAPKNWCFWTMVLEKTLKSLLDSKEIKSVHPKGNQSWIFIGRTDACWGPAWGTPPMAKVIRKEAWHTQRHDQASGNPLFPSIQPPNQSLFHALTYTSDFTGGSPP